VFASSTQGLCNIHSVCSVCVLQGSSRKAAARAHLFGVRRAVRRILRRQQQLLGGLIGLDLPQLGPGGCRARGSGVRVGRGARRACAQAPGACWGAGAAPRNFWRASPGVASRKAASLIATARASVSLLAATMASSAAWASPMLFVTMRTQ